MKKRKENLLKQFSKSDKYFCDTQIHSRNIITDWVQGIRNMLGLRLKAYENIINNITTEMLANIPKNVKWYKLDIEEISSGGFMVTIYGEIK